jgi:hypothetical protein
MVSIKLLIALISGAIYDLLQLPPDYVVLSRHPSHHSPPVHHTFVPEALGGYISITIFS